MAGSDASAAAARPKRVRTGCLTCRARHLKCDEGKPDCMNCKKSNRQCKRGFRLNFIDTQVEDPPVILRDKDFFVHFQDESREIASEYAGGVDRYPKLQESSRARSRIQTPHSHTLASNATPAGLGQLPPMLPGPYFSTSPSHGSPSASGRSTMGRSTPSMDRSTPKQSTPFSSAYITPPPSLPPSSSAVSTSPLSFSPPKSQKPRQYLTSADETFFMQVFVEEVGLWMDSLDPQKHFSRILPFKALDEPMLLNAFLACGAQHLSLVNPAYTKEKARNYNDIATNLLFNEIKQNQGQNTELCATTSVILNVYEIMCNTPRERMNHIKGARTLVRTCGWNANSTGVGAACFWLNTTIQILTCLHLQDYLTEDPDAWGINMDFNNPEDQTRDEIWAHRIVFILAKISNFRVSIKNGRIPPSAQAYEEWNRLKNLCNAWNEAIPRSMHPMARLNSFETNTKSCFPEVWIIERIAIVSRLFYHTALLLLSQINPLPLPNQPPESPAMATENATMICGIAAHVKDRGVASVTLRSLAIAAECLTGHQQQQEVLKIFSEITRQTGWHTAFIARGLKVKWGWEQPAMPPSISTASVVQSMVTPITPPSATSHLNMGMSPASLPSSSGQSIQSLTSTQYSTKPYDTMFTPTSLPSSSPSMTLSNPSQYMPTHQHQHHHQQQQHSLTMQSPRHLPGVMNSQPMFTTNYPQAPTLPSNAGQRHSLYF